MSRERKAAPLHCPAIICRAIRAIALLWLQNLEEISPTQLEERRFFLAAGDKSDLPVAPEDSYLLSEKEFPPHLHHFHFYKSKAFPQFHEESTGLKYFFPAVQALCL